MLSKPSYGWTNIAVNNRKYPASYLTDVPFDCLNSMINALENGLPFCVEFDAEGWHFIVLNSPYIYDNTQVITYMDDIEVKEYDIDFETLAKELYNDIHNNLEDWVYWMDYALESHDDAERRRNLLKIKLCELRHLIEKWGRR